MGYRMVSARAVYYSLKGVEAKVHNFPPQTNLQSVVKIKNILQSRGGGTDNALYFNQLQAFLATVPGTFLLAHLGWHR